MEKISARNSKFSQILFAILLYTLLVILWGAWVRISHSGDGCGDTWPLCRGQLIPEAERGKTWVEYSHRMMSGLFGLVILALYFRVRKFFPKDHPIQFWAKMSLIFTITEALLGAKLVLFKLVSSNDSPYRAFVMGLHLVNSMMLTGSIASTWNFSRNKEWRRRLKAPWSFEHLKVRRIVSGTVFSFFLIAVTGSIAALSNTLFPTFSLAEGFAADWDPSSHFLIRLRGLHPLAGILFGGSLALTAWLSVQLMNPDELLVRKRSKLLAIATSIAIAFGIATLISLAPVWMKLVHLLLAHTVWICLVLWIISLRWNFSDSDVRLKK
jgi:cytochrome c oxidase assembly protein subunit 15